ncbi:MAG: ribosome-associated translation inhibitor RaiA [Anaerolineae bacterium]|nr:ribosome-associated translation inhibitor RaiA [Anaerolineae bacterium]
MNIEILGHNMKVSEALEIHTRKKLERLDRYLPNIANIRVEYTHEHTRRGEDRLAAQITIRHDRGAILRAQESTQGDVEVALQEAVERMYRQIERFKGKKARKGKSRFSASLEEINAAEASPGVALTAEGEEEEAEVSIVRRKNIAVTAMNEEEAIEQMELLGHTFFVYYDDQTRSVNVVYKRRAGGYGILVPQLA